MLRDVTLGVEAGQRLGVLGPNGAGKTTLLAVMQGAIRPDAGTVTLFGVAACRLTPRERRGLGGQLDAGGLPPNLTAGEVLRLARRLYARGESADSMLARVGLARLSRRLVRDLSTGEHRRLAVAAALIGRPRVCFLDEPTLALDPDGRRQVWGLIRSWSAAGTTFVLATNAADEAEALCHDIVFLRGGAIVGRGAPRALVARARLAHRIHIAGARPEVLTNGPEVVRVRTFAEHTVVWSRDPGATLSALLARDPELIHRVEWHRPHLEDALFEAREEGRLV